METNQRLNHKVVESLADFLSKNPQLFSLIESRIDPSKMSLQKRFNVDLSNLSNFVPRGELISKYLEDRNLYLLSDIPISPPSGVSYISTVTDLSPLEICNGLFLVYFLCDESAIPELDLINMHKGRFLPLNIYSKTSYRFINPICLSSLRRTFQRVHMVSHWDIEIHENICEAIQLTNHLDGDYVEVGVYKGGSALTALNMIDELKSHCKQPNFDRHVHLFDTFDGFNYEASRTSADAIWHGTHRLGSVENTVSILRNTFSDHNNYTLYPLDIIKDPLPNLSKGISVLNVDVDLLEATFSTLVRLSPLVQQGGIIIVEDPASTPALYGSFLALHNFLSLDIGTRFLKIFKGSQYFLIAQH